MTCRRGIFSLVHIDLAASVTVTRAGRSLAMLRVDHQQNQHHGMVQYRENRAWRVPKYERDSSRLVHHEIAGYLQYTCDVFHDRQVHAPRPTPEGDFSSKTNVYCRTIVPERKKEIRPDFPHVPRVYCAVLLIPTLTLDPFFSYHWNDLSVVWSVASFPMVEVPLIVLGI